MEGEQPANDVPDLSESMYSSVEDALSHLKRQLAVVDARVREIPAGGFDPDLAKAGASLAKAVKDITAERRQLERHDRRMTSTPAQRFNELLKYVKTLDPVQRGELASLLVDLDLERA